MSTLKLKLFKSTIHVLFLTILFTSTCAQSDRELTSTSKTSTEQTVEKPKIDIHQAVLSGNLEAVKQHIAAKTDLNQKDALSNSTPLMLAITFNKPEIAEVLIKAGSNLSIKNNDGSTALHTAAFFGRIEMVQMLIDAKADKSIRNNYGATPRETVLGNFADIKPIYEMLIQQLEPMGFVLDMNELEKARPVVAMMLE